MLSILEALGVVLCVLVPVCGFTLLLVYADEKANPHKYKD